MKKLIIIKNKLIILEKNNNESEEIFYERITYILNNLNNTNNTNDIDDLINQSYNYINKKYLDCIYF